MFNINPSNTGYVECEGYNALLNQTIRYDFGTECNAKANAGYKFTSWSGIIDPSSKNSTFRISDYGTITANFIHPSTFFEDHGNTISGIALIAFIILPTLFSAKPEFLSSINNRIFIFKNSRKPKLADIDSTDILGINVAVIAGVLIFLSLEGFDPNEEAQINLITANIVFPFAISAIAILLKYNAFGTRFMIAGFVNLMVSLILIVLMRF